MDRINEQIHKELSLILRDMKDPRIDLKTSVLRTETTRDLKYCKVYITTLGGEDVRQSVKEALADASGYIRRELAHRMDLRITPELIFLMDDSIAYSIHMSEVLKAVHVDASVEEQGPSAPEEDA